MVSYSELIYNGTHIITLRTHMSNKCSDMVMMEFGCGWVKGLLVLERMTF